MIRSQKLWGRKGSAQDILQSPVTYLLILLIFFVLLWFFVHEQSNGAALWGDYYAKEVTLVINGAKPGDSFTLEVHTATKIADKHNVPFEEVFSFEDNKVCVKLSPGRKTCQKYFNDIRVMDARIRTGVPENVLDFRIVEAVKV